MIAIDTNILVYCHREDSPWHQKAYECLKILAEGNDRWAIPWPCIHEFLSIVTHPKIYKPPTSMEVALHFVQSVTTAPSLVLIGEGPSHLEVLGRLCIASHIHGPMVHDCRIAALCVQHRISALWSADRDFGRFGGLTVKNPLVA